MVDLSAPYYLVTLLSNAASFIEQLDPIFQVGIAALALAIVSKGSPLVLAVGLAAIIYFRLWQLEVGTAKIGLGTPKDPGDASQLSNQILLKELEELDPDRRYEFLYALPELFHLLHQIIFMRQLARDSFERVLAAADHYLEGSTEIKKTDNLRGVGVLLQQSIERAEEIIQAYLAMGLHVPLMADRQVAFRFKDTLKAIRIVLRRDLVVLRGIAERHINQSPSSYEPLPNIDGPRPS